MVLDRIVARTREDLARRQRDVPVNALLRLATPSTRPFAAQLSRAQTGFIFECKRASPSEGLLRDPYDPVAIALEYAAHADAISVLTDTPSFQGSLAHLKAVSEAVSLPVLRKDFVVAPYQVVEARAYGADAVLLMLSVLDDAAWRECAAAAADTGIETLTEVHTRVELDRALALGAPVIGINNRDLGTLRVDLAVTLALAPVVPADRTLVCESGIRSHADVLALRAHVDAFLVGTTLMREADLGAGVRRLVYGETKVCGLTRTDDALACWREGATFGGLIFAPESPRAVTRDQARGLARSAPLRWVGVFVNAPLPEIVATAGELGLAAVQLHGEESASQVAEVRRVLPATVEVWKAVRIKDRVPSVEETGADRLVLDTWRGDRRGGTGERFDWSLLDGHPDKHRLILSGGLTPEVAAAAESTGCFGLDVNSGVEDAPGRKSPSRIAAFFTARRGTGRGPGT